MDHAPLEKTLQNTRRKLLAERTPAGDWVGGLSSSALSTAVAVAGLELWRRASTNVGEPAPAAPPTLIKDAFEWLTTRQNPDGGWGDTTDSPSNISTTTLCWAAFGVNTPAARQHHATIERAAAWLANRAGNLTPTNLARAIDEVYGPDRSFSTPILTMCALTGRFGDDREAWRHVPSLPFELAMLPRGWFNRLGLPVVSYALPALIAVGQARHRHRPTRNPITQLLRNFAKKKTLRVLDSIQPASGGFLEAAPLTGFVLMSLASIKHADHPVARRAVKFLIDCVRNDGSWPIDANLSTWVTTLSVGALSAGGRMSDYLPDDERAYLRRRLLDTQYRVEHPYTQAAPGGWAWTDQPGGVPDGDDTSGALLALHYLTKHDPVGRTLDESLTRSIEAGVSWLLDLQNKDGGIPTFCRGWGKLPFDRSTPDLTAHALRAWHAARDHLSPNLRRRINDVAIKAIRYLVDTQRGDGAWIPLWFGNQHDPNFENPLYGAARVLLAADVTTTDQSLNDAWRRALSRGVEWILNAQQSDGGWGGSSAAPATIEETAMAVEALAYLAQINFAGADVFHAAVDLGVAWLIEHTKSGVHFPPAPIGLYFAKLWYSERLYPLIFTNAALERVCGPINKASD